MIRLKNVSKIYYQNGSIATGFSKVSTKFDIGEFIVIVGESGSGKSTLLNVISGLDSYEEGEMYINGEETSHYTEKDFEDYRRKYVANIFQAFNLVNSYTVKQNVELVLLIHGFKKKEIKTKVTSILKKVGLYELRNRRVSRLSGGQKQKVAIARALAKETPIIVADEPTGNLDKEAAREIFKLLSEISKDKLVVVVTHNLEQVEKYATRILKMHDGRLIEDKKIKDVESKELVNNSYKEMSFSYKLLLAIRNAMNVGTKFLIMFAVFLILSFVLIFRIYGVFEDEYDTLSNGSEVFVNRAPERIVVNKQDKSVFTEDDLKKIKEIGHVDYVDEYDASEVMMDLSVIKNNDYNFEVMINKLDKIDAKLLYGRKPEKEGEAILTINNDSWEINYCKEYVLNQEAALSYKNNIESILKVKIVGIAIFNSEEDKTFELDIINDYYEQVINFYNFRRLAHGSSITVDTLPYASIIPSSKLKSGEIKYSSSFNDYCEGTCVGKNLKITVEDLYFTKEKEYLLGESLSSDDLKDVSDFYDDRYMYSDSIFISYDDMNYLINNGHYQISVFVDNVDNVNEVLTNLGNMGLNTLALKDTLALEDSSTKFFRLMNIVSVIVVILVLVSISSVVINLVFRSRNKYFAVVRMLGGSMKLNRTLINLELIFIATLAYICVIFTYVFNHFKPIFNFDVFKFVKYYHLIGIYLVVLILAYVLALKFSKRIFKDSMITTYNMEV